MVNNKSFVIISIFIFLVSTNVFASNIGRAVYGVLTETYQGAAVENSSAGDDYAHNWGSPSPSSDKIEGANSTSVGAQWWFGVCFHSPQNMSEYRGGRLYFSAKVPTNVITSNDGNVFKVSCLEPGKAEQTIVIRFDNTNIKRIDNDGSYLGDGISNDNLWHTYYIDLSYFDALNFSYINYLFIVGNTTNNNTLLIDNVYWTKPSTSARSFDVKIKTVIGDTVLPSSSSITWSESSFRKAWEVAEQYLELDLDYEATNNWSIQVLLDGDGKSSRNGLYAVVGGEDLVLPMAWRISANTLPNSSGDTLQIAEVYHAAANATRLYDYGKHGSTDPWWYPWIYAIEKTKPLAEGEINFTKVWDIRGIHTYAYDHEAWDTLANFYEKKPKIYFCADCRKALGGVSYTTEVEIILNLE